MNCQLYRIDEMVGAMRAQKARIIRETGPSGLSASPNNSRDWECGTHVTYLLPSAVAADALAEASGGWVALKTGRHVYTEWDPVLQHRGAHHPALNPFELEQNQGCRMDYSKEMCRPSIDILGRTVCVETHPDNTDADVAQIIRRINHAAASLATGDAA